MPQTPNFAALVVGVDGLMGRNLFAALRAKDWRTLGTSRRAERLDPAAGIFSLDLQAPAIDHLPLAASGITHALILAARPIIAQCEEFPAETRAINVDGTLELARLLAERGIAPVFTSTDYVFDGETGGYTEESPLSPNTEYGRQKAEVERELPRIADGLPWLILRPGKLMTLAKGDRTLLDEMAQLLVQGKPVRAATDQHLTPTLMSDVVPAVIELMAQGKSGIFNVCSPETWVRYDLACELAEAMGLSRERVEPISIDDVLGTIVRPKRSASNPAKIIRELGVRFTPVRECIARVAANYASELGSRTEDG